MVPLWAAFAGFGTVAAVAVALAGTERSLGTILGGLLGGQFMLHALFSAAQQGMSHHPLGRGQGGMTLAHVLAAAGAALWLRYGERAVWRLARRIFRPLLTSPAIPVLVRPRVVVGLPAAPTPFELLRHAVVRRGPPFG